MTTAVSAKEAEREFSGYGIITQTSGDKAEPASKEAGATESAKDKRNERSSLVIRRAKPVRGICALLLCAWQHKRLCHNGRMKPFGWEENLFTTFCTSRQLHGPITSILPSLLGTLTTPVDQLVRDLCPYPVVVTAGTGFVTLLLAFYSWYHTETLCCNLLCQEIAFHKVSGIFKEQSNSSLQNAAATS